MVCIYQHWSEFSTCIKLLIWFSHKVAHSYSSKCSPVRFRMKSNTLSVFLPPLPPNLHIFLSSLRKNCFVWLLYSALLKQFDVRNVCSKRETQGLLSKVCEPLRELHHLYKRGWMWGCVQERKEWGLGHVTGKYFFMGGRKCRFSVSQDEQGNFSVMASLSIKRPWGPH